MAISGEERAHLYAAVYEAVDASVALQRCLPAAQAKVQRALVHLRGSKADVEAVRQLESMSVLLHQLTAASLRPKEDSRRAAAEKLGVLAEAWMARLPIQ